MNRPSRIGPFSLEEQAGGPGSSIFRAVHSVNKKSFALRVFPAPNFVHAAAKTEFSDELAKLKRLQHPRVARCFGGGIESSWCYLVHEWRPGERLSDRLARRGKLSWESTLDILRQIAEGLVAAHELEVAHGALSSDKILLGKDDAVTVIDFRWNRTTNLFRPVDSPAVSLRDARYRSPEQFRGVDPIPLRSDLYALGCVAFECLAGRPPFAGETLEELTRAHLEAPPPRVASAALDCPVWVDALVAHLLDKRLTHRPHSPSHVILQIDEARKRVTQGAGVASHALGGFSALKVGGGREEAKALIGDRSRDDEERRPEGDPWWERPWAIAAALVLGIAVLGGGATIAFWPKSEEQLFARAVKLMESDSPTAWGQAKDECLDPLVKRFPDGAHRAEVDKMLDLILMREAEGQLKLMARLQREPPTEGGRQYKIARDQETRGDTVAALETYQALVEVFSGAQRERAYVLLAKRQIAALEQSGGAGAGGDVRKVVEEKLAEAEVLLVEGKTDDGKRLLGGLLRLYRKNPEVAELIERAQKLLDGKIKPQPKPETPTEATSTGN